MEHRQGNPPQNRLGNFPETPTVSRPIRGIRYPVASAYTINLRQDPPNSQGNDKEIGLLEVRVIRGVLWGPYNTLRLEIFLSQKLPAHDLLEDLLLNTL